MYSADEKYLSDLLMENNLVTESQIEDARGQRKATESLIETIIRTGQAKESDIAKCYALANGMTYVDLTNIPAPDKTIIDLIDLDVARRNSIVPIGVNEAGHIQVAVGDPFDLAAIDNLNHLVGHDVEAQHSSSFEEINDAIGRWYDEAIGGANADDELVVLSETSGGDAGADGEVGANDAPVIKLVNQILMESFNAGASDIHIEPLENSVRVRYRIDGQLHEVANHPRNLLSAIVARFKIMTGAMSIAEKRLPQDARIQLKIGDKDLEDLVKRNEDKLRKESVYTGESGKNSFKRTQQLRDMYRNMKVCNFMFRHYVKFHKEQNIEDVDFTFEVKENHHSAFTHYTTERRKSE